jgi:excisionase family DNA binding protein
MEAKWIPVKEAAKLLEISERQVLNRIHTGKLKAKREGKIWLVHGSLSEPNDEAEQIPKGSDNEAYIKLEETVELLKEQLKEKDKQIDKLQGQFSETQKASEDASQRHDTIVMQLTRQLEQSQRMLSVHQEPWYRKWFRRKTREQ